MNPIEQLVSAIDESPEFSWHKTFEIKRNAYLTRKGDVDRYAYYIVDGAVRAFIENESDLTIRFGYAGSFIAALPSFLQGHPSEMSIQALRKTTVRSIHKETLYRLLNSNTEYNNLWREIMESLVVQQLEREIDILTASPVDRYKRVLERSPELFQQVSHKYIASYLRMTPETLSRLKKD